MMNASELQLQTPQHLSPNQRTHLIPETDEHVHMEEAAIIKHDIRKFEKTKWIEKEVRRYRWCLSDVL